MKIVPCTITAAKLFVLGHRVMTPLSSAASWQRLDDRLAVASIRVGPEFGRYTPPLKIADLVREGFRGDPEVNSTPRRAA